MATDGDNAGLPGAIELRPRGGWEAMDDGLHFLRVHWRAVFVPWLVFAAAVHALLVLGFGVNDWATTALFWWLKPLFDRLLLHVIAGAAHGRPPTFIAALRALPRLVMHTGLGRGLTLLRLSSARSQHLPVWQLERQRGDRIRALFGGAKPRPVWLMLACINAELSIYIGPILLAILLAPEGLDAVRAVESLVFSPEHHTAVNTVGVIAYFAAVALIEPVYVAAGYAAYLNQRVIREGLDLEPPLRRIGERLRHASTLSTAAFVICMLTTLGGAGRATADDFMAAPRPAEEAKAVLESLGVCQTLQKSATESMWVPRSRFPGESPSREIDAWLSPAARGLQIALWFLLGLGVAYYLFNRAAVRREPPAAPARSAPAPSTAHRIGPASGTLPADPAAAALDLVRAGDNRGALSLLYRAAIDVLIRQEALPLLAAHTERDILRLAHPVITAERFGTLRRLAECWEAVAYANREPSAREIEALCSNWQIHFGAQL